MRLNTLMPTQTKQLRRFCSLRGIGVENLPPQLLDCKALTLNNRGWIAGGRALIGIEANFMLMRTIATLRLDCIFSRRLTDEA